MQNSSSHVTQFESFYLEYQPMVLQLCLGYMKGDIDLANDISQEVFMNVWIALPGFKAASSIKTWIYRITVNTCLLYIRNVKKKKIISLDQTKVFSQSKLEDNE